MLTSRSISMPTVGLKGRCLGASLAVALLTGCGSTPQTVDRGAAIQEPSPAAANARSQSELVDADSLCAETGLAFMREHYHDVALLAAHPTNTAEFAHWAKFRYEEEGGPIPDYPQHEAWVEASAPAALCYFSGDFSMFPQRSTDRSPDALPPANRVGLLVVEGLEPFLYVAGHERDIDTEADVPPRSK